MPDGNKHEIRLTDLNTKRKGILLRTDCVRYNVISYQAYPWQNLSNFLKVPRHT